MAASTPNGKIDLRLWSDDLPLRERAHQLGLSPTILHDKGGPVVLANGRIRESKASRHFVGYKSVDLEAPADANRYIGEILKALSHAEMAKLIASGVVDAEIGLAAFRGEINWEDELDPAIIDAARMANVDVVIEHYDKFTDEGAPLSLRL
jgi:hypothetical protein